MFSWSRSQNTPATPQVTSPRPSDSGLAATPELSLDLVALDEALDRLAARDTVKARLVELRFFAGLSMARVAEVLGVSLATAERHWAYAKAWLLAELNVREYSPESP